MAASAASGLKKATISTALPSRNVVRFARELALTRRPHHDDDLVPAIDHVDQFADAALLAGEADEFEDVVAVVTGAFRGRVAAVPLHGRIQKLAQGLVVAARRRRQSRAGRARRWRRSRRDCPTAVGHAPALRRRTASGSAARCRRRDPRTGR